MAKITWLFVCILIIGLDVGAGICGIEAEIAQNKEKHLKLWIFECKNPSHDAFKFGVAAAALLGLAHIIANLFGGCSSCFCSQDDYHKANSSTRHLTTGLLILSWIIMGVGIGMLVIGAMSNEKSKASCGVTHHHLFSYGGILCFVHALFATAYYVSASSALSR